MSQSVKDALADAETLRLNVSAFDWVGAVPMALARGADVTAYEMAKEDASLVFYLVPTLRVCTLHEVCLLDEGSFCRQCGIRLPSYAAAMRDWSEDAEVRRAVPELRG